MFRIDNKDKRIRIIVGHYGSGKTEFAVNYVMKLAADPHRPSLAIIDLDIANVYFRSREKAEVLEANGVELISSSIGHCATLDIPALSASMAAPLQNDDYDVVMDVGGDEVGARVLARFKDLLTRKGYDMFCIINAYREQTQDIKGAIKHVEAIEASTGMKITGLINNAHLLRETSVRTILTGQKLVENVSRKLNIPIKYTCALENLVDKLPKNLTGEIFPVKLYMREEWM